VEPRLCDQCRDFLFAANAELLAGLVFRHCERSEAIHRSAMKKSVDCFVASLLAMTLLHKRSSYPAQAGYPVRRGFSVQSSA
jgi:hypothetical protein